MENMVLQDLLTWRDTRPERAEIFHWRTTVGEETDFVIEAGDRLLPIQVKATTRPRLRDISHLLTFRTQYPHKSRRGLLLHTGDTLEWITPRVLAAPWWKVL